MPEKDMQETQEEKKEAQENKKEVQKNKKVKAQKVRNLRNGAYLYKNKNIKIVPVENAKGNKNEEFDEKLWNAFSEYRR